METTTASAIDRALLPGATIDEVGDAAARLEALARRGVSGDEPAHAETQRLLLRLHEDEPGPSDGARAWLAERVYRVEDPVLRAVSPGVAMSRDEFVASVAADRAGTGRLAHPLARHMFEGSPSREDVRIYLVHHWYRSRSFYRVVAELGLRLDVRRAAIAYENLFEETGRGGDGVPHPVLLERLLEHFDLPASYLEPPPSTAAHAYLNNRWRCARHPDLAWGLALLYAVESSTPGLHARIHALLRRLGVPDECCEFHRLHATLDEGHAADVLALAGELVRDAASQAAFRASLALHRRLGLRYFDAIHDEMTRPRVDRAG